MGNNPSVSMGNNLRADFLSVRHIPTMEEPWKSRLQDRMRSLGLDMKALSRRAGQNETFVRDMLKRDRAPAIDRFIEVAHALGVKPGWLLTGEGDSDMDDGFGAPVVKLVGTIGADPSGRVLYAEGDSPEEFVPIAPGGSASDSAVEVKGHSMRGIADDGSLVYFSSQQPATESYLGETVVCAVDSGEVLVKKLLRGSERGLYDLESVNGETRRDELLNWVAEITAIIPPRQARRLLKR